MVVDGAEAVGSVQQEPDGVMKSNQLYQRIRHPLVNCDQIQRESGFGGKLQQAFVDPAGEGVIHAILRVKLCALAIAEQDSCFILSFQRLVGGEMFVEQRGVPVCPFFVPPQTSTDFSKFRQGKKVRLMMSPVISQLVAKAVVDILQPAGVEIKPDVVPGKLREDGIFGLLMMLQSSLQQIDGSLIIPAQLLDRKSVV